MKSTLTVQGTHCKSCKLLIEDICGDIPGVQSCTVDIKTGKTIIEHDGAIDLKKIKSEIEKVGKYKVRL